jgi:hypothetical protein
MESLKEVSEKINLLEEALLKRMREISELKAAISMAFSSEDLSEIRKNMKRACAPYWMENTFKKEVDDWAKGKLN